MAAAKFQIHLSDILLLATIPALGAMTAICLRLIGLSPPTAYGLAILSALPGALAALWFSNTYSVHGPERAAYVMLAATITLFFGMNFVARCFPYRSGHSHDEYAVNTCRGFCEAQEIYRRTDYDGDGVLEYAQHLRGTNSLLERLSGSGDLALIDKTFGDAEGPAGIARPKVGYVFKVLAAQGPEAYGGQRNYMDDNGNMTGGYALVASPAVYGQTGLETILVSNSGTIFRKDLGINTKNIVDAMTEFNPDSTWEAAN